MHSSTVALRDGSVPWLRQNISYQAAWRAATRSPISSSSRGIAGQSGLRRMLLHQVLEIRVEQTVHPLRDRAVGRLVECLDRRLQAPAGIALGRLGGAVDEVAAFEKIDLDMLPGIGLLQEVAPPGLEIVDPGLDRVAVARVAIDRERPAPAVVVDEGHRGDAPVGLFLRAPEQAGGDLVVAVGDDVGGHLHRVADLALDRKPAAFDLRRHRLDQEAVRRQRLGPGVRRAAGRATGGAGLARRRLARSPEAGRGGRPRRPWRAPSPASGRSSRRPETGRRRPCGPPRAAPSCGRSGGYRPSGLAGTGEDPPRRAGGDGRRGRRRYCGLVASGAAASPASSGAGAVSSESILGRRAVFGSPLLPGAVPGAGGAVFRRRGVFGRGLRRGSPRPGRGYSPRSARSGGPPARPGRWSSHGKNAE